MGNFVNDNASQCGHADQCTNSKAATYRCAMRQIVDEIGQQIQIARGLDASHRRSISSLNTNLPWFSSRLADDSKENRSIDVRVAAVQRRAYRCSLSEFVLHVGRLVIVIIVVVIGKDLFNQEEDEQAAQCPQADLNRGRVRIGERFGQQVKKDIG